MGKDELTHEAGIFRNALALLLALALTPPAFPQAGPAAAGAPLSPAQQTQPGWPSPVEYGARVEAGDLDRVRRWLDAGVDPNYVADRIGTGLMIGAWHGNIALMDLFVSRGADVNRSNAFGEQALMHAAWRGHLEAAQWLLARGAQLNREPLQWSALHYAVFAGHGEIARTLMERGADINARSPNGSSVLMMAVYEGREELARTLIERGADPKVKNEWGDGALEWAMKFNHTTIARLVTSKEEFAEVASQPKAHWGEPTRSEFASEELTRLLRVRNVLETKGLSLERVDRQIATERVRVARAGIGQKAVPPRAATLEISAKRSAPREQKARLVHEKRAAKRPAKASRAATGTP